MNMTMNTTVAVYEYNHEYDRTAASYSEKSTGTSFSNEYKNEYENESEIRTRNTDAEYEQILSTKIPSSQFFDGLKHDDLGPFSMKVFSR